MTKTTKITTSILLSTILIGVIFTSANIPTAFAQPVLFGLDSNGRLSSIPSSLYTIDPTTGAPTLVGSTGFLRCSGMDFDSSGTLFATCDRPSSGSDYHYHTKKLLESGQMKYEFPNEIYTKDISGISFDVMPAQISVNNLTVYQEYYAARENDYILLFILSYSSDSEIDEINRILNELQFSK